MGDWDGAGSLFALGMRLTKLDPTGAPAIGVLNAYRTDALVKADLGLEYEEGEEIIQKNGAGQICVSYKAPDALKRGTISGLVVCSPDPNVLEYVMGGTVVVSAATGTPAIGYKAPEVGVDPNPNGIGVELWTRAVIGGAYAGTLPYYHWILPRTFLKPAGGFTLAGDGAMVPEFEGFSTQSVNWGDGPANDLDDLVADRVWQYIRTATLPDLSPGFTAVTAGP